MNIETKYNLGDTVWFLYNNRVEHATVLSITTVTNGKRVFGSPDGVTHVTCEIPEEGSRPKTWHESKLFPDKPSLLASL